MKRNFAAGSSLGPLGALAETYEECLTLSRKFMDTRQKAEDENEAEAWEEFLSARQELFDFAEHSLSDLRVNYPPPEDDPEAEERQELTDKILGILGQMGQMEDQLAAFLGQSLKVLKATLASMRKSQPVFKRYGSLPPKQNLNFIDQTC